LVPRGKRGKRGKRAKSIGNPLKERTLAGSWLKQDAERALSEKAKKLRGKKKRRG